MRAYRKKDKKRFSVFILVIIIIAIFVALNIIWPQKVSRSIFVPILNSKNFVSGVFSNMFVGFKDKKALEERVSFLEEENSKLKISLLSQSFTNSQIEDYNVELEQKTQGMISKVLNRPPFSPYDTLLILKGDNNIEVGDSVFIRGVYIGEIEQSDLHTAVVKLKSASGNKTVVRVSDIESEAEGKGGGQFTIKVPKDVVITIGEAVMFPDLNYALLGSVGHVVEDPMATFKTVYFSIPVAFQDMNFVSIIKKDSVL